MSYFVISLFYKNSLAMFFKLIPQYMLYMQIYFYYLKWKHYYESDVVESKTEEWGDWKKRWK